ncbi:acyl-CoA dehydrogenase family protein [Nocardia sp. CDC159]|uniref:Acyl-CoA dehydrogenase family protein n=1 Tax=Nocardia pulmonis TaxID=2951408 RepID=A0A9X2E730_9NOCA|nr:MULTISPECIES: acyl-CoA dehydrogenase family protein [Nocardia]MCM6772846.1 acyl-CoA dehydrogenase family protein [Nocardia pulmonis]MCM6785851.1 acyl-CoA dehydrogenase family protein [Nocardia sp. CDC159]
MSIATTDEHKAVQESMRGWAASIRPIATMRTGSPGYWREFWPSLVDLGIFRVAVGDSAGGADGSVSDLAVLIEQAAHDLVGGPVLTTALAGLVTGGALAEDTPCGVALGDPVALSAKGTELTGVWDTVLGAADGTAVLLPVDGGRWCLVPANAEGLHIVPLAPLDASMPLARVECAGVRVAAGQLFENSYAVADLTAALVAAEAAGIAGWCLETATEYAKVREQFGRKIGEFQAVKHICAWMLCRAELIRAVAADAAAAVDARTDELPLAAAIALTVALDAAVETAKDCIQVLGGIGFTWEHDAHLYLRRAVALRQLLGGSARWRARVAELVRQGRRRTVGLDLGFDEDPAATAWDVVGLDAGEAAELAADLARIAALPAQRQRDALVDTGLLAPHWPRPYGRGAGPILRTLIDEQVRRAAIAVPDIQIGNWAVPTLLQYGTPEQIERFADATLRGRVVWCQLFSEPDAGSDLAALRTTATRAAGGWRLRGQKVWTSLANVANWAICLARTDASAPKHRGISYFLVDMSSPGIEVRPLVQITGEARFSEVFLDDVFVPDDCLVGELGAGWKIARSTLSSERVAMGGSGIGDELERLIATAPAVGPGAELIADRLGALVADAVAGLLLETRAAQRMLAGIDPGAQSSVRKLVGVRHRQQVAEFAVELAGVAGAQDSDVVKEFLLTRCLSIAGGTEQILLTVAGERILGLPRESHG